MFSFSTECNPGKALRIVNVAGKNKESVSSDGRLFTQTVMEELPTIPQLRADSGVNECNRDISTPIEKDGC